MRETRPFLIHEHGASGKCRSVKNHFLADIDKIHYRPVACSAAGAEHQIRIIHHDLVIILYAVLDLSTLSYFSDIFRIEIEHADIVFAV